MSKDYESDRQRFWNALGYQQVWLEEPREVYGDPIYMMRTKPGYIFDDSFWEVFHRFSFKVYHVAYYGPERLEDVDVDVRMQDTGVFELRFAPLRLRHWVARLVNNLAFFGKKMSPCQKSGSGQCGIGPMTYRKSL